MNCSVNLHGNNEICIWNWLQRNYDQRSIFDKKLDHAILLTLKLLCTSVSSKSITIHFLCISECLTGGSKYRFWLLLHVSPLACPMVCVEESPSIDPPFWFDLVRRVIEALRCRQQQKTVSHIRLFDFFVTFSSIVPWFMI